MHIVMDSELNGAMHREHDFFRCNGFHHSNSKSPDEALLLINEILETRLRFHN